MSKEEYAEGMMTSSARRGPNAQKKAESIHKPKSVVVDRKFLTFEINSIQLLNDAFFSRMDSLIKEIEPRIQKLEEQVVTPNPLEGKMKTSSEKRSCSIKNREEANSKPKSLAVDSKYLAFQINSIQLLHGAFFSRIYSLIHQMDSRIQELEEKMKKG